MANIGRGQSHHVLALAKNETLKPLMDKMESSSEKIAIAATMSIRNMVTSGGALIRDKVLEAGCMEQLSNLLRNSKPNQDLTEEYADLAENIIGKVKPIPKANYLTQVIESLCLVLIRNNNSKILSYTSNTRVDIIKSSTEHIPAFMAVEYAQTSLLARFTELSNHADDGKVAEPVLFILIELVTGSNEQQL